MIAPAIPKQTNEQYHDREEPSNSWLQFMKTRPERFGLVHILKTMPKDEPSPSMQFGHLVHCLALEPEAFDSRYAFLPNFHLDPGNVTKAGKRSESKATSYYEEKVAEFEAGLNGKEVVSKDDFLRARACCNKILSHDALMDFLPYRSKALIEEPILFQINGLVMRCKLDWLSVDLGVIVDIKTAIDETPDAFSRKAEQLGYFRQAALYKEAARQKYGKEFRFIFGVVKSTAPFETGCYEYDAQAIKDGMDEALQLVEIFKMRTASGNWLADHSQGKSPTIITTSKWRKKVTIEAGLYDTDTDLEDESVIDDE